MDAVAALLDDSAKLSEAELDRLSAMIDQARKETEGKGGEESR